MLQQNTMKFAQDLNKLIYYHVGYNNFVHQNTLKMAKQSTRRYDFCAVIIFQIVITQQKDTDYQIILYHFLHHIALNYGKAITMKHVLHIYYLTNVDDRERVY